MFQSAELKFLPQSLYWLGLFLGFSLYSNPSKGTPENEMKLECQLEIKKEFFHKSTAHILNETKKEIATVSITSYGKNLRVIVEGSEPIISVSTSDLFGQAKNHYNKSTEEIWEISTEMNSQRPWTIDLRIDRNTGLLTFNETQDHHSVSSKRTGFGYCSKVDTTKKKF